MTRRKGLPIALLIAIAALLAALAALAPHWPLDWAIAAVGFAIGHVLARP